MIRRFGLTAMTLTMTACAGEQAATPPPAAPTTAAAPPPVAPSAPAAEAAPALKPSLAELEKKTITAFYAAFTEHDTKKLAALYAPDAVSASPEPGGIKEVKGPEAIAAQFNAPFTAMPDLKAAPVTVYLKNDVAIVEWSAVGTNTGEAMGGPPTNKKAAVWGLSVYWFNPDGLITRDEEFHDQATIAQQLGRMPGKPRDLATLPTGEPTWVTATGTPDEDKLVDQMKATWPETWSKHDGKAYAAVVTDDGVHSEIAGPMDYKGKDALLKEFAVYAKATPDMTVTIDKAWAFAPNVVIA